MASKLVVVESPAKSRTLKKYLGKDFQVLSSVGHIIDLPPKSLGVDLKTFEPEFANIEGKKKVIDELKKEMKTADEIYLASDPDREGEAISYHLASLAPKGKIIHRVLFNAITRDVVNEAINNPTVIDQNKVESQFARRILDRLIGYSISPLLNRSIQKGLSAGRVQSAALRMVCDREELIRAFIPEEYWKLEGHFLTPKEKDLLTELFSVDGKKIEEHPIANEAAMKALLAQLEGKSAAVKEAKQGHKQQQPPKPLITSTLQQAASTELRFSSKQTMRLAQSLYENGHITYMRTDSTRIDPQAAAAAKDYIGRAYGESYIGSGFSGGKAGSAKVQDAHEAIRPTEVSAMPGHLKDLDANEAKLYDLIWRRFVASQMAAAKLSTTTVDVAMGPAIFRASGSAVVFDGFYKVLKPEKEDKVLPEVAQGDALKVKSLKESQHFTEPPGRYTEAGLIKALEKEGIGRPSTYASIISVLTDREYVDKQKNHLIPTSTGEILNRAMKNHFPQIVDLGFTADMERKLDDIENGQVQRSNLIKDFYTGFQPSLEAAKTGLKEEKKAAEVETAVPCPKCGAGITVKTSRFGKYGACSKWAPKSKFVEGENCSFTLPLPKDFDSSSNVEEKIIEAMTMQTPAEEALGNHPDTGEEIYVKSGPYGPYVQMGAGGKGKTPKRVSLPKDLAPGMVDYEKALSLLELPRTLGNDPASGKTIKAGLGRFGPFVQLDKTFASLKAEDDVLTVNLERALQLLAEKGQKSQALRILGNHTDGEEIGIFDGRYGPYVKHGKINATIPKGTAIEDVTMEEALTLLATKAGKGGTGKKPPFKKKTFSKTKKS